MRLRQPMYALLVGVLLLGISALGARTVRWGELERAAPMEMLLTEAAEAEEVVSWDITVTRNERVDDWIDFLQGRNGERTKLWLERSAKYGPMIQAELRARGMPQDLLYLALIESGFSTTARSKAAAVGMWQFIEETGRRYGLEVSSEVDERKDPIKATQAALGYLQDLHERFGSWYLAAAAYNTGENRVDRILRERAGGARGHDSLFWKIAPYLPRETRDYVPLMLAAGHIAKTPSEYGFDGLDYQDPLDFETVWVPGEATLSGVAKAAGVSEDAVKELNPHLIRGRTPAGRGWGVRIPTGLGDRFAARFPSIYREERTRLAEARESTPRVAAAGVKHKVRRGETLSHLARRYDVTVAAIQAANGGIRPTRVRAGQTLVVPASSSKAAAASNSSARVARFHNVRRGENLTVIARRYEVSVGQLRSWNGLGRRNLILAGQRLRVSA